MTAAGLLAVIAALAGCAGDDPAAGDAGDRPASERPSEPVSPPPSLDPTPPTETAAPPSPEPGPTEPGDPGDPGEPGDRGGAPERPPTGRDWPHFGAVYHGMWDMTWPDRAELLDKLVATGATWVRIGVQWAGLQPKAPDAWNEWALDKADRVIRQAAERGLQVSVTLLRTPDWANGGLGPERLPSDPESYARVIEQLAHRYRDQVQSWEIYNEPNNDNHLQASVDEYVRLLCAAYPAVHRGNPDARVVFGGTSGVDYEYIDAAYEAGAAECFDVLAVHPYNGEHSPVPEARSHHRWWWRNIELVRQVMRRHDDLATPVWFTEFGWSTHPNTASTPSWERGVTYEEQARYAVQLLRITRREYPYVERAAWYAARDETHSTVENNNFGLFTIDLEPKPIVARLRAYLASR